MERLHRTVAALLLATTLSAGRPQPAALPARSGTAPSIWDRDNLVAWSVGAYDAKKRGPVEKAEMLQRLGLKHYSFYWLRADFPAFQAEIDAMKAHGIEFQGWWAPFEPDDPVLDKTLALWVANGVHPHLWFFAPGPSFPELNRLSHGAVPADFDQLPIERRAKFYPALSKTVEALERRNWPKTPEEYRARVAREAARIKAIAAKVRPYGIKVDLYGHHQWIGNPDVQADIIELLKSQGVNDVGIVYNFSHARNAYRDDTKDFARIWRRIQPYVSQVDVAGVHMENGTALLPGQGDGELAMMKIIQDSGWRGPVGVNAETGGDAEVALRNAMTGLNGLVRELNSNRR